MHKYLAALAAMLLMAGPSLAATDQLRLWTPYNDFYELQEKFQSIPAAERERLGFRFRLVPQDPGLTPDQGQLFIMRKNERIRIAVDASGVMHVPRNEQYHKEDLAIHTNLAKNQRLGIKAEVLVNLPPQASYPYADLIKWMQLASDATRSRAGMWSMFMPKSTGLDVKLADRAAYAVLSRADGQPEHIQAGADGYIFLAADKLRGAPNLMVSFSAKPLEALPHYEKNMTLFADGDR